MTCASSASQAAIVRQRQQFDRDLARPLVAHLGAQRLEGFAIGRTREQLVAVDQIGQRHRLLAQRMDDMPVVDDVAALAVARPAARV